MFNMKKIIIFIGILLLCLSVTAQKYYYYKGHKIYLHENPLVRYVKLQQTVSPAEAREFQNLLNKCCWRTDEYSPYFSKYYIKQEKYAEFLQTCITHDSIINLHTPNFANNDTLSMYPTRTLLVKTQTNINLQAVLTSQDIPFSEIIQSIYNNLEYTVHITDDKALDYAAQLYETGLFTYSEPNFVGILVPTGYEDNPLFSEQWAIHNQNTNINLLPAWAVTTGHPKIKVAVIDSGVDLDHPDLVDNLLEGYDAVNDSNNLSSVCCGGYETLFDWHGTCCAGIIGAANNDIGIVGVAHTSKIIPIRYGHHIRIYYKDVPPNPTSHWIWSSQSAWLLDALNHACYEDSADVINCSFMTLYSSSMLDSKVSEICEYGRNGKGCVVVVGAGNTENVNSSIGDTLGYLARHPSVISVGSVTPCGKRVVYGTYCGLTSNYNSCYGDSLDVVAPGIRIPTITIDGELEAFAGTSSATPHVAGIAALILSVNPCLTREEVKYIIESTCTKVRDDVYTYSNNQDHPNGTWNIQVGYGLVNAGEAVALAQQMGGYTYVSDTIITSNTTWNTDKLINQNLTIDSLATLTITDTLFIGHSSKIIVRPGGKLVVDGGTLTSACPGEMWQGIEVVGDRTKQQHFQYQGIVELKNGATIENALCGIRTGLREDTVTFATTGGIIFASDATFLNNCRAVEINSYAYPVPGTAVTDYVSNFNRCSFTVDDNNLFATNNTAFTEHVRLWDVKGVDFNGCTFENLTSGNTNKGRGIYADDAGVIVETYCTRPLYENECECPDTLATYGSFSGFNTAIEVNTTGNPYAVRVNETDFENNCTGVKVNGNNYVTVINNNFNLQKIPRLSANQYGLYLDNCTGYWVEGNTFVKSSNSNYPTSTGIYVNNSGSATNSLYRNDFSHLYYGIYLSGKSGGLSMSCGSFDNNTYGIYIASGATVAHIQGSSSKGADISFPTVLTSSIYNANSKPITYYYSVTGTHYPTNYVNIIPVPTKNENTCSPTPCNALPDPGPGPADGLAGEMTSDTYHAAVRAIMADSLLDLSALEQWHAAAQSIGDPYSLTETRFMMGYNEPFVADADDAELANYAEFHAMKVSLRGQYDNTDNQDNIDSQNSLMINWYALTPAQIAQLQTIAERNAGRASVMAKGVLCFFHGICYDDDSFVDDNVDNNDNNMETRSAKASPQDGETRLNVYPNPTDDLLFVELSGAGIQSAALFDLQGRVVTNAGVCDTPQRGTATMNLRSIPAGVYVLRVTDTEGREYHQKIVKR